MKLRPNKLEYSLRKVKANQMIAQVRQEPERIVGHNKSWVGFALYANVQLGWKGLPGHQQLSA